MKADDPALDIVAARAAIARIEFFRSERPGEPAVTRLGGLTNLVFRVDCNGDSYVMRIPGAGTEDYIDRGFEAVAAREAARVGVSPEVILADARTGIMVSQFVEGRTMSPKLFKSTSGAPARAGDVLRRLHTSGAVFKFRFDLFGMMDEYQRVLSSRPGDRPEGYEAALRSAQDWRRMLASKPLPVTACHCDLLAENFIDTGKRMWLVDWEYSGMNDPMWDLGDACVEAGFDAGQEAQMIAAYFGGEPKPAERGRIAIYKALCDLLWTQWGLIQHATKNPADDYWQYATRRFERCRALLASPQFGEDVAAAANG
jgi:thiamine kinase-like enzyme